MAGLRPLVMAALVGAAGLSLPLTARAQTWVPPTTTPSFSEVVSLDRTGEPGWPWGSEDLAGDGATFSAIEQGADVRSVYATADDQRFWVRVYFSATTPPPASTTAYVFIDSDLNESTGGSAAATTIDPELTADPSGGGYEWVVVLAPGAAEPGVWQWSESASDFVEQQLPAGRASGESGVDTDPLLIGDDRHGYLQGMIERADIGVNVSCDTRLFVRAISSEAALAPGDVDAGGAATCVPADANADRVPDVLVPPGCSVDADCPAGGVCLNGECLLPSGCTLDADCAPDEQCSADGVCVARPGGDCATSDECAGLVCQGAQCVPCTTQGASCSAGSRCGPDGRCVPGAAGGTGGGGSGGGGATRGGGAGTGATAGLELEEGDRVRGGAFKCSQGNAGGQSALIFGVLALAFGAVARRSAERRAPR